MRAFILIIVLLLGVILTPAHAQTAAKLEAVFNNPQLNYRDAAIFILEASEKAVFNDPTEAFQFAMDNKWLPKKAQGADTATLKGISLLFMRSFNMKGGIFFSLFGSPRHAFRELVQMEVIRLNTDPDMAVSGPELLLMLGRLTGLRELAEEKAARK